MNIHVVCQCADDVNKHGDVQVKRLGRLASINKFCQQRIICGFKWRGKFVRG